MEPQKSQQEAASSGLLGRLNEAQREAVTTIYGPLLVLAGAGTGKTRVLITRIAHLIQAHEVHPSEVVGITFTKKAAHEMRERLARLLTEKQAKQVVLSTFHGLGVKILREYGGLLGLEGKFGIADEQESETRVRKILKGMGQDLGAEGERPPQVRERILKAKTLLSNHLARQVLEGGREPEKLVQRYRSGDSPLWEQWADRLDAPSLERFAEHYNSYQEKLVADNVVDYQDLLSLPLLLFLERREVLRLYHEQWRFVLVDEYQDTDYTQEYLLQLLSGPEKNLCVVGDDDQAIYSWRGAKVENIREFPERWPSCEVVTLEQNYRSTGKIIEAANAVLESRPEVHRHPKELWTENPEGDPLQVWANSTQETEALNVARDIKRALQAGYIDSLDDVLVLYRVNAISRALEDGFRKEGVPYNVVSGTALHERKEVRDLLSYIKVADNPQDFTNFERAAQNPSRGIGPVSLDHLFGYIRTVGVSPIEGALQADKVDQIRTQQANALEDFGQLIRSVQERGQIKGATEGLRMVLDRTGLRQQLIRQLNEEEEIGDVDAAQATLRRIHDLDDFLLYVEEFERRWRQRGRPKPENGIGSAGAPISALLDDLASLSPPAPDELNEHRSKEFDELKRHTQGSVTLMSVHAAKGLEAPRVYVVGLEEQVFPVWSEQEHERARSQNLGKKIKNERMAEEARLFYVALTRAKNHLVLSASRTRERFRGRPKPMMQSRFVSGLPETVYVYHDKD